MPLPNDEHLHWIRDTGSRTDSTPALPISGVYEYNHFDGTEPTDNIDGLDSGTLNLIRLTADFQNMQIDARIEVEVNDNQWVGNGSGPLTANQPTFSGTLNDVTVTDTSNNQFSGEGAFSGFFTNFGAGNVPDNAGMTYFMRSPIGGGTGTTINGAAAMELTGQLPN